MRGEVTAADLLASYHILARGHRSSLPLTTAETSPQSSIAIIPEYLFDPKCQFRIWATS